MHSHGGHSHDTSHLGDARLVWAIVLNLLLSVIEVVVGVIAGSLSLIADAAHNFNDCMSLVVTLVARKISRKEADDRRTFGYRRAEVIGAFLNLILLTLIGFYLIYEAVTRYFDPQEVHGWPMIIAASVALVVDVATVLFLAAMRHGNINLRAGFLHKIADALASVAVIVGGVLILLKGWYIVDLLITIGLAIYILYHSLLLLKPTVAILMESVPADVNLDELVIEIQSIDGVQEMHHIHIWELDESHRALEAHIVINTEDVKQMESIKLAIKHQLHDKYTIQHSTLEFEFSGTTCHSPTHTDPHTQNNHTNC